MDTNYGIITLEDGSKSVLELSEAEMEAVMEARGIKEKMAEKAADAKKAAAETIEKVKSGTKENYDKAVGAIADKFNLKNSDVKKILAAAGITVASGVAIAAVVAAIKKAKKNKKESTNESVMFENENGEMNVLQITDEEFDALIEARIEADEENVCRLVLSNEEYEAIMQVRAEEEAE